MNKVRLIWDFRGPNALHIAKHHKIHLEEFIALEKVVFHDISIAEHSEFYISVFLIVNEDDMTQLRTQLKPHRGQRVNS